MFLLIAILSAQFSFVHLPASFSGYIFTGVAVHLLHAGSALAEGLIGWNFAADG
jgi:hypothetical protein